MKINPAMRKQMEADIRACDNQVEASGSQGLYNELIARYSTFDPAFTNTLPKYAKFYGLNDVLDYRPELKNIAAKLKAYLLMDETADSAPKTLGDVVAEFVQRGERIGEEEFHHGQSGFRFSSVSGPQYDKWMSEINTFNERHLKCHPLYSSIHNTYFHRKTNLSSYADMMGHLRALANDHEFWNEKWQEESEMPKKMAVIKKEPNSATRQISNKVFIVHGHDNEAKLEVARTLENGGFEPVILHEQADNGLTVIEKIEKYTDVAYAIVLYTECDIGRAKNIPADKERHRARQNVVFEHGYLIAKLGRDHVSALVKGDVETPSDISGILYIPMDPAGAWKMHLAKNMQAAGLPVDFNEFLK
jgi:predicted nucleotide-binding protein